MADIEVRRKAKPDPPLPTRTAGSSGWRVQCAACGRNRIVSRAQLMVGTWTRCPACQSSEQGA
jgi:hypothetical protein